MTPTTTRFFDAVKTLEVNGHAFLASACLQHFEREAQGLSPEQRGWFEAMFDEVLTQECQSTEPLTPEDAVFTSDFTFLRGLARSLQALDLVDGEEVLELTEFDIDVVEGVLIPPYHG